ncbi:RNA polymerase sigma factor [Roseateles sp. LYH14W]|uniref:RNA polymerase sigma factor n=1 Tax=Pelomonas parva TaxID=3299032 RepID=A0ABW7F8R5_9BURK
MKTDWLSVFSRAVSALMRRGCRSEQDAEDLVQDAYVRLAQFSKEKTVDHPEALLMKIALNLSIDAHRALLVRGEEVSPEDVVIVDGRPSAEDVVQSREELAQVGECLAQMNERTRSIFLDSRVEGMSYNEIALKYGISRSAVEKHISKGVMLTALWMEDV